MMQGELEKKVEEPEDDASEDEEWSLLSSLKSLKNKAKNKMGKFFH